MNAATAYQNSSIASASPVGLVILLYQGALVQLRRAIAAMDAQPNSIRDIEIRTSALNRVLAIVGELQRILDFERGGEVARNFDRFYRLTQTAILSAVTQREAQPLRDILPLFQNILEAWRTAESRPQAAPGASAAWTA